MILAGIAQERFHPLFNRPRGNLPVLLRQRDHLVAARLYSARFMNGNVAGLRRENALIARKHGVNRNGVGLRAAFQKINAGIRRLACLADERAGPL